MRIRKEVVNKTSDIQGKQVRLQGKKSKDKKAVEYSKKNNSYLQPGPTKEKWCWEDDNF